jgi:hypothetical protein
MSTEMLEIRSIDGLTTLSVLSGEAEVGPEMCLNNRMGSSGTSSCIRTHLQNRRHRLCFLSDANLRSSLYSRKPLFLE